MASKTLTISLPSEMLDFLDENSQLSPSKVFQGAIQNIQNSLKCNPQLIEANQKIERLQKALNHLQNLLEKQNETIST